MERSAPAPFELTVDEASMVQAEQSRRQTEFAQKGATFKSLTLVVPLVSIGLLLTLDRLVFANAIPAKFYVGLIIAYLMGLFVQLIAMAMTLRETKQRMLQATPQVWERREIQLREDALVQITPTSRSEYNWAAFQSINSNEHFIWFWLTDFNAVIIPVRAFPSHTDATAFETEARQYLEAANDQSDQSSD